MMIIINAISIAIATAHKYKSLSFFFWAVVGRYCRCPMCHSALIHRFIGALTFFHPSLCHSLVGWGIFLYLAPEKSFCHFPTDSIDYGRVYFIHINNTFEQTHKFQIKIHNDSQRFSIITSDFSFRCLCIAWYMCSCWLRTFLLFHFSAIFICVMRNWERFTEIVGGLAFSSLPFFHSFFFGWWHTESVSDLCNNVRIQQNNSIIFWLSEKGRI